MVLHCSYGLFSHILSTVLVLVELSWRRNVFFCSLAPFYLPLLFDHYYSVLLMFLVATVILGLRCVGDLFGYDYSVLVKLGFWRVRQSWDVTRESMCYRNLGQRAKELFVFFLPSFFSLRVISSVSFGRRHLHLSAESALGYISNIRGGCCCRKDVSRGYITWDTPLSCVNTQYPVFLISELSLSRSADTVLCCGVCFQQSGR